MSEIPDDALQAAERADAKCQRDNCQRMDCNGFLCVKALEAVYRAAEKRGKEEAAKIAERDADWSRFGKGEIQEAWEVGFDAARDYRLGIVAGRAIAAAIRGS